MALTKEQFLDLRKKGLDTRQIVEFEKRGQPATAPRIKEATGIVPSIGKGVGGITIGALKGVGSTLSGLSSLGQKGLEKTIGAGLGVDRPVKTAGEMAKDKFFTPKGMAQKVGFGAEQLAEWFVPSSKLAKFEKGM